MAYTDFMPYDLRKKFGAHLQAETLFPNALPIQPSDWLTQALKMRQAIGVNSEKSCSKRLVTLVLLELCKHNNRSFSIYSGINLDVDLALKLRGECDFIFSYSRTQNYVMGHIFCIAGAKKQELLLSTLQCAAQLIAARSLNEFEGNPTQPLYGCSTTGVEWHFLKYEGNEFTLDKQRYHIAELPVMLDALQSIVIATAICKYLSLMWQLAKLGNATTSI